MGKLDNGLVTREDLHGTLGSHPRFVCVLAERRRRLTLRLGRPISPVGAGFFERAGQAGAVGELNNGWAAGCLAGWPTFKPLLLNGRHGNIYGCRGRVRARAVPVIPLASWRMAIWNRPTALRMRGRLRSNGYQRFGSINGKRNGFSTNTRRQSEWRRHQWRSPGGESTIKRDAGQSFFGHLAGTAQQNQLHRRFVQIMYTGVFTANMVQPRPRDQIHRRRYRRFSMGRRPAILHREAAANRNWGPEVI